MRTGNFAEASVYLLHVRDGHYSHGRGLIDKGKQKHNKTKQNRQLFVFQLLEETKNSLDKT